MLPIIPCTTSFSGRSFSAMGMLLLDPSYCGRLCASKPPLQKLRLADLRIPWLVFVFLWIDWVGERMKQFFWLGLNTLLPLVLAALCYLALCRDGVSWLRRSEPV